MKTKIANIKENEVASNVDFLVQNKYIEEVAVENFFAKSKFGNSKPSYKYRLGREGLAYFEHGSKFDTASVFAGIGDITGNGNYVVIGNQNSITNVTNATFAEGHKLAEDLRRRVNALGELNDDQKVSVQAEIETIKSQLAKKDPDKDILRKAKENLAFLADIIAVAPFAILLFNWITKYFHL